MTSRAGLRVIFALAGAVVAAGAFSLFRPGYTPDEEFTLFAVRGIRAHGLPLLPSGLLYDRGLLYSYLAWLAAVVTGVELPAFRAPSLVSAAGTLVLGYASIRRLVSPAAGLVAATLVAASLPFWAVATTGRFYAPFLLTCVGVLFVLASALARPGDHRRDSPAGADPHLPVPVSTWWVLGGLAFASRVTHELAFTLMAIPTAGLALSWVGERVPRTSRRHWVIAGLVMLAGLGLAQAVLTGLHFVMPPGEGGGATMLRRFFLWQVLNLFESPTGAPLGVVSSVIVVAWLVAPHRAAPTLRLGIAAAVVVLAFDLAAAMVTGAPAVAWWRRVLDEGLTYPLDMFWHLADAHPLMMATALALLVARLLGAGGEWHASERAAHLGWVGWVLWFGVIESGLTTNYVLLPTVCLLAAIGIDLVAIGEHTTAIWPGRRAQIVRAALFGAALVVVVDQWPGAGTPAQRLADARPTIYMEGLDAIRAGLRPDDLVACTDELACLLLVGRVDAWLALDDYVRERFVVERASGPVGVYAGAPAAFTLTALVNRTHHAPARVIVVDLFKEYPVGDSSTWLPRATEAARFRTTSLLSTTRARIEEIHPTPGVGPPMATPSAR